MAVFEILARDHTFGVSTTTTNFITISGVNNWSWAEDSGTADARTFDDGGSAANLTVSRAVTVTLEGQKQVDTTNGTRDAGQAAVEVSMGKKFGRERFRYYRIAMMNGDSVAPAEIGHVVFQGSAKLSEMGGGNDDLMPWGVEIDVYGAIIAASGVYTDLK